MQEKRRDKKELLNVWRAIATIFWLAAALTALYLWPSVYQALAHPQISQLSPVAPRAKTASPLLAPHQLYYRDLFGVSEEFFERQTLDFLHQFFDDPGDIRVLDTTSCPTGIITGKKCKLLLMRSDRRFVCISAEELTIDHGLMENSQNEHLQEDPVIKEIAVPGGNLGQDATLGFLHQ